MTLLLWRREGGKSGFSYTSPKNQGPLRGEYMYIVALSQCMALTLSYFELFTPEFLTYVSLMLDLGHRASSHYMLL
jgi:hypothetical protein